MAIFFISETGETFVHWWHVLKEQTEDVYVYAYSCESRDLDGIIEYRKNAEEPVMVKPCSADEGSDWAIRRALRQFYCVIREGFPPERHVCSG